MRIFDTLIPLFGTWVATIIAFCFSRENFAAAAKATRKPNATLQDFLTYKNMRSIVTRLEPSHRT